MIKCALHFSNKSMKKKQNKTKQHKKTKNYKPIYNKQNNRNIYPFHHKKSKISICDN